MANQKKKQNQFYQNNPNLKAARVPVQFTQDQMVEYYKCSQDPVYFIENYVKLISLDKGAILFKLFPYQKRVIEALQGNRKLLVKLFRQSGKSQVIAAYITWYVIFNDFKTVAILANKAAIAREIFSRVQFSIENLPFWLQQGVVEWNKTSFELENQSKCFCAASSPQAIRGKSINFLLCVSGNTKITLRDKSTGEEFECNIQDIANGAQDNSVVQNSKYDVLTDTGWSDFFGVKVNKTYKFVKITTTSGKTLSGTYGHKVMSTNGFVDIQNLQVGDIVQTTHRHEEITDTQIVDGGLSYDLIGVKNNSRYYTNGILSHNCDEFAHLAPNLAQEFVASVFPTISSSQESKLVLVQTPKGMNEFYKLWVEAEEGKNGFVTCTGQWTENPYRDQKWADEQRSILGDVMFNQEISCQFTGSSKTLVSGEKLGKIPTINPIYTKDTLTIYEEAQPNHTYITSVDTSRGQHLDFSAFVVIDITQLPYKVVATFKDNKISTMAYPFIVYSVSRQYNDAYCLVEVNDAGGEVANTLFYEYEYEHVYFTHNDEISEGGGYPGIRTTKKVKQVGCSVLRDLIETDQLIINSNDILQELHRFIQKGASYAAEDTAINDDLCACLFIFAYLTKQSIFYDLTDINIRKILAQKTEEYISESVLPVGFHSNGMDQVSDNNIQDLDLQIYGGYGVDPLEKWMMG